MRYVVLYTVLTKVSKYQRIIAVQSKQQGYDLIDYWNKASKEYEYYVDSIVDLHEDEPICEYIRGSANYFNRIK